MKVLCNSDPYLRPPLKQCKRNIIKNLKEACPTLALRLEVPDALEESDRNKKDYEASSMKIQQRKDAPLPQPTANDDTDNPALMTKKQWDSMTKKYRRNIILICAILIFMFAAISAAVIILTMKNRSVGPQDDNSIGISTVISTDGSTTSVSREEYYRLFYSHYHFYPGIRNSYLSKCQYNFSFDNNDQSAETDNNFHRNAKYTEIDNDFCRNVKYTEIDNYFHRYINNTETDNDFHRNVSYTKTNNDFHRNAKFFQTDNNFHNTSQQSITSTILPPTTVPSMTTTSATVPSNMTDCKDWFDHGVHTDGIYSVNPDGKASFDVFCDMTTDGGGWTVFQKRINEDLSFYDKNWTDYKVGFDNGLENNLWLGNDRIHVLTYRDINVELRIDFWFDRSIGQYSSGNPNGYWWEKHTNFFIDDEAHAYTLHLSQDYGGNATNDNTYGISSSIGSKFATNDVPNGAPLSCRSGSQLGGWWMGSRYCVYAAPNGKYVPLDFNSPGGGFFWMSDFQTNIIPRWFRMMMRSLVR
uniref:Fibrinogen C-terminal domain-containing protein n=1 Tax=Plectus sambesii TaxID=2011161 RepID=A0A914X9F3_9BILA